MEHHRFEQIQRISSDDAPPFSTSVDQNLVVSLFPDHLLGTEAFWANEATQSSAEHGGFFPSANDFHTTVVSPNTFSIENFSALFPWSVNLPFPISEGEEFITSSSPSIIHQSAQFLSPQTSEISTKLESDIPLSREFFSPVPIFSKRYTTVLPSANQALPTQHHPAKIYELSQRSEDQAFCKKKRTRRVHGQVNGNNKTGQRGKLICLECRKIRSRCIYSSEDQSCEFCVRRNRQCVKVYGPKTRGVRNKVYFDRTKGPMPVLPAFSFIEDCNLSGQHVSILRKLYNQYHDPSRMASNHVFFQHLWGEYGFTPTDKCLLFANLLYGSRVFRDLDECALKLQFHASFLAAFEKNQITDCHLFAIVLAAESCVAEDLVSIGIYKGWFFEVLKRLSKQHGLPTDGSRRRLCQFASSLMRRVVPLHSRNDTKITLNYLCDINLIPQDIWNQTNITAQDPRLARVLPIRVCQGDQLSWMQVMEWFLGDRYNMFLSFQRFVNSNQEDEDRQNWRCSLTSVRQNVNTILQFPDVSKFFDHIRETQTVIGTVDGANKGLWHVSRARGFLRTFFHNLALLTLLESFTLNDTEQSSIRQVIQQVFQAEHTLLLHSETLFASVYHGREALFGAIGILLSPQFVVEKEVLNKLRNQVIEGWKWYWEGLGIFWCADCPCRPTSRVKRFWRTTMLMDDYLAFLSQNPWIWGIPMKGFEDVQLDLDEIEKAQGPCRACGKIWWND